MPIKELDLDFGPKIAELKVFTRKFLIGSLSSSYITAVRGQGLEFDGYRPYSINDDAKEIDWKATLRAQDILVKKYIEERNLNVFFLFDTSNSMLYSSTGKLKAEYAAEVIASFGFIVLHNLDHVGLSMFTDTIMNRLNLGSGSSQFYKLTSELRNTHLYGGGYDLINALKLTFQFLKRKAILIIVSDFIGIKGDWKTYIEVASEKYDVIPIMIRDPNDREFPPGMGSVVVEDPYSDEQVMINPDEINQDYVNSVYEQETNVKKVFSDIGIQLLDLQTDQDFVDPLAKYFSNRVKIR